MRGERTAFLSSVSDLHNAEPEKGRWVNGRGDERGHGWAEKEREKEKERQRDLASSSELIPSLVQDVPTTDGSWILGCA